MILDGHIHRGSGPRDRTDLGLTLQGAGVDVR